MKKTLKQFLAEGGKIEALNNEHLEMFKRQWIEDNTKRVITHERSEYSAQCPFCGCESEWHNEDEDEKKEIFDRVDSPNEWKQYGFEKCAYKCKKCDNISYDY